MTNINHYEGKVSKHKHRKCDICNEEAKYILETINYRWDFCSDCYFKIESEVVGLLEKIELKRLKKEERQWKKEN